MTESYQRIDPMDRLQAKSFFKGAKNRKPQKLIDEEIAKEFGPKKIREYKDGGKIVSVYEYR